MRPADCPAVSLIFLLRNYCKIKEKSCCTIKTHRLLEYPCRIPQFPDDFSSEIEKSFNPFLLVILEQLNEKNYILMYYQPTG
jgi:hypothetical protein